MGLKFATGYIFLVDFFGGAGPCYDFSRDVFRASCRDHNEILELQFWSWLF